jgi:hypothetical protein
VVDLDPALDEQFLDIEGSEFSYPQSGCSDADAAHATVPLQVVVIVGQMAAGISLHFPSAGRSADADRAFRLPGRTGPRSVRPVGVRPGELVDVDAPGEGAAVGMAELGGDDAGWSPVGGHGRGESVVQHVGVSGH